MFSKKKSQEVSTGALKKLNVEKIKSLVQDENHDFADHQEHIQKIFTVLCKQDVVENDENNLPEVSSELLETESNERKLKFIKKIADKSSRPEKIFELSKILLSPSKIVKTNKENEEKTLKVPPMKVENLRKLVTELILVQTARARHDFLSQNSLKKKEKLSPKAAEVQEFFDRNSEAFGCQTENVAEVVSAFLNEPIEVRDEDDDENNFNNTHIYALINDAQDGLLIDLGATAIESDGCEQEIGSNSKPATDQEIRSFVRKMSAEILRDYFGFLEVGK